MSPKTETVVETPKGLMAEAGQYEQSHLFKALFEFQGNKLNIPKTTKGYNYMYAALDSVVDTVREPLQKAGLMYLQFFKKDNDIFTTRVIHVESGEMRDTNLRISTLDGAAGKMNSLQALGATITYIRRYTLMLALGLITEDTDGAMKDDRPKKIREPDNTHYTQTKPTAPAPAPKSEETVGMDIKMLNGYNKKISQITNIKDLDETAANFEEYIKRKDQPFSPEQIQSLRESLDKRTAEIQLLAENEDSLNEEFEAALNSEQE